MRQRNFNFFLKKKKIESKWNFSAHWIVRFVSVSKVDLSVSSVFWMPRERDELNQQQIRRWRQHTYTHTYMHEALMKMVKNKIRTERTDEITIALNEYIRPKRTATIETIRLNFFASMKFALIHHFSISLFRGSSLFLDSLSASALPEITNSVLFILPVVDLSCNNLNISVARLNLHVHRSLSAIWASISIESEAREKIDSITHCWTT